MNKTLISYLWKVLSLCLGIFLVHKVIKDSGVDVTQELTSSIHHFLAAAFLLYGVAISIGIFRWRLLLEVQGIHLPTVKLIQLTMTGIFFNLVLPGAVSGDVMKMVYVTPHSKGKTAEAVLTIFLDRVIGLMGLFLVASISVLASLDLINSAAPKIQWSAILVGAGSLFSIGGIGAVEYRNYLQNFPVIKPFIKIGKNFLPSKIVAIFQRFAQALDLYRNQRSTILFSLLISMLAHTCLALSLLCIGRGFSEILVKIHHYLLTTQVANAVGAIPLTPLGIGPRDFVISMFLEAAGASKEKAGIIPPFYTIFLAAWSLIGGFFFIFLKKK